MKKIVHLPNEHIKSMQRCRRAQVNFGCLEQDHRSSNNMTKNLKNLRIIDKKHSWSMYFTVMKKFKLVVQNFENRAPLQSILYTLKNLSPTYHEYASVKSTIHIRNVDEIWVFKLVFKWYESQLHPKSNGECLNPLLCITHYIWYVLLRFISKFWFSQSNKNILWIMRWL